MMMMFMALVCDGIIWWHAANATSMVALHWLLLLLLLILVLASLAVLLIVIGVEMGNQIVNSSSPSPTITITTPPLSCMMVRHLVLGTYNYKSESVSPVLLSAPGMIDMLEEGLIISTRSTSTTGPIKKKEKTAGTRQAPEEVPLLFSKHRTPLLVQQELAVHPP